MEARGFDVKRYTYDQFLELESDGVSRYELIDGIPFRRSRPSIRHQQVNREIISQLNDLLRGKQCEALPEIDVVFSKDDDASKAYDVFIPDIAIICDKNMLKGDYCNGSPTVIIEILSKSTAGIDRLVKFDKYARYGVNEYWIITPEAELVDVYLNKDGVYKQETVYTFDDAEAKLFSIGCILDLTVLRQQ